MDFLFSAASLSHRLFQTAATADGSVSTTSMSEEIHHKHFLYFFFYSLLLSKPIFLTVTDTWH